MTIFILLLALAAAAWLTLLAIDVLIHRPAVVTWLVLTLVVVNEFIALEVISVELGEFRVSPIDIGYALVAMAAVLRLARLEHVSRGQLAIIVLSGMAILSLAIGLAGDDIGPTVNDFRTYLGFLAAALYFSTVPREVSIREAMARAWLWAGVAIAGVVLLRWAGRVTGTDLGVVDEIYDAAIRVLNGPTSFFVASCALVLLLPGLETWSARPRMERYTGIFLLVLSILLNRRAVWLALAVALVILLVRQQHIGRRMSLVVVTSVVLFVAAVPIFAEGGSDESVAQTVTDTGTLSWRAEGWRELLASGPDEPPEVVIGQPFGTGYARLIDGNEKESNPHSFYLQTYLRSGVIGLGALVVALMLAFIGLLKEGPAESGPLARQHLLVLLAMQAVWFLAWPPGADQGIILGLATAATFTHIREQGVGVPAKSSVNSRRRAPVFSPR